MSTRAVVESFWQAMKDNDWERAAAHLIDECQIDWPCTGERIVGRNDFAAIQASYPTDTGRWTFDVHRLVVDGSNAVSEVTASDGQQSARVVVISAVADKLITHQVEYWMASYDPPPGREQLVEPGPRLP